MLRPQDTLKDLARHLLRFKIITVAVSYNPTFDDIINSFISILPLLRTEEDMEDHCRNFANALNELGGGASRSAACLREEWSKATLLKI